MVKRIVPWQERRASMGAMCANCYNKTFVDNFYKRYDSLVDLYNEKFAKPAQEMMNDLTKDGVLNPAAVFEHDVQWVLYELWHDEGRRARHGASMMGPDDTHWHRMYEWASTTTPSSCWRMTADEHRWIRAEPRAGGGGAQDVQGALRALTGLRGWRPDRGEPP